MDDERRVLALLLHYAESHLGVSVRFTQFKIDSVPVRVLYLQESGIDQGYKLRMVKLQKQIAEMIQTSTP